MNDDGRESIVDLVERETTRAWEALGEHVLAWARDASPRPTDLVGLKAILEF